MQMETPSESLLHELQIIWDEVGESDVERDKMLLELELECLDLYRRKVDQANQFKAQLRQTIADSEAELARICSAMGERPAHIMQCDQKAGNLKEELSAIVPELEEMRKRKCERRDQFVEVLQQIQKILNEICSSTECNPSMVVVDETDLSLRKLEELHRQLQALQKEKGKRLKQVLDHLNTLSSLCLVLGIDFKGTINEVQPGLDDSEGTKNLSDDTIERLAAAIQALRKIKIERVLKLQDLATTLLELWNLIDTPIEEQQRFQNVTSNIAASEHEITEPNILSDDFIIYVEAEVSRLEEFKASKMKELVLKKRSELEEICRRTHLVAEADSAIEYAIETIESGAVDPAGILDQIELQIATAKEEAFSRKELLEKVEKWLAACEEECWLEEYNKDENRYNAGRGAHLILKRAEKARLTVSKLPALVDALASKTTAWERERGVEFTYDGIRLLSMLEEYSILRQEKEQERRRQRDQKKLQGQLIAEQEVLFGSKPSPSKLHSGKKVPRTSTGGPGGKRNSLGGAMLQTPKSNPLNARRATPQSCAIKKVLLPNDSLKNHQDEGVAALPAGGRGLDSAGLLVKQHSLNAANACDIESPMLRKPFSPVSKANIMNFMEDKNKAQKMLPNNETPTTTPSKLSFHTDEENRTPMTMPIPVPTTPSTVSVPMQTAITPIPASVLFVANAMGKMPEEIEYSFEERRAGFVLPHRHLKSFVQV
ncbi:65-kDa microtubule-associated protein 3-like [Macadamia integrifolia]|uniref:65-kDa microtubule-associated protein 3-like n=1 Tax=Macadamia integrifolia TaxID=60698 RepID=UPI001C4FB05F|nr:65-kDa microtubule-associated protein 3-like [Macadamia integrifolia]XP_042512138.1 65-kDa microtubule-associated protein 3-like [Macadamia integrifolia]